MKGKRTCKILKDIRRQIAEENDISFVTSECQYKGDCLGTCPKCEAELRYLEQELENRRRAGKLITLAGLSTTLLLGTAAAQVPAAATMNDTIAVMQNEEEEWIVSGVVSDVDGELPGANIIIKGTDVGCISDLDGRYSLKVKENQTLLFSYIGFESQEIHITRSTPKNLNVRLIVDSVTLSGEVVVVGYGVQKSESAVICPAKHYGSYKTFTRTYTKADAALYSLGVKQDVVVKIVFQVGKDGNPTDFKVKASTDDRFNEEALSIAKKRIGRWVPRKIMGKATTTKKRTKVIFENLDKE